MGFEFPGRPLVLALLCLSVLAQNAFAGCTSPLCSLATDGTYDKIVIGTLVHVASDKGLTEAVHLAKQKGYWERLPASTASSIIPVFLQQGRGA